MNLFSILYTEYIERIQIIHFLHIYKHFVSIASLFLLRRQQFLIRHHSLRKKLQLLLFRLNQLKREKTHHLVSCCDFQNMLNEKAEVTCPI